MKSEVKTYLSYSAKSFFFGFAGRPRSISSLINYLFAEHLKFVLPVG
jgi:hypothetical protein